MSHNMFLYSTPEIKRTSMKMLCPTAPRPARRDLSSHLQMHNVTSIFIPLPFDCQNATRESRTLEPRPGSILESLPKPVSRVQHEQRNRASANNDIIGSRNPIKKDDVSLKSVTTTATIFKDSKKQRRRSSCNSAA